MIPRTLFNAEHEAFRDSVRRFLEAEVKPHDEKWQEQGYADKSVWKKAGENGFLCMSMPEEYGGSGADKLFSMVLMEEQARINNSSVGWGLHSEIVAPYLFNYGSDALKKKYLPKMSSGEMIGAIAMSEPGAGSDLQAIKTAALRRDGGYVLNGSKTFITNGWNCDLVIVVAKTDPAKGAKGTSLVVVDTSMKGFSKGKRLKKMGLKGQDTAELFFDNVEVPAENLIGEENKGWTYAKHLLSHERTNIADVNRAKREIERLKRIAKAEGVYDDGRFRDQIALLEIDIVALEMLVLRVLSAEKSGKQSLDIAGLLKIKGSEIQQRYTELTMLAAGPFTQPFVREAMEAGWQGDWFARFGICAPLAGNYFNFRKTTIYGGSNEVQRNIVAQTVLG